MSEKYVKKASFPQSIKVEIKVIKEGEVIESYIREVS